MNEAYPFTANFNTHLLGVGEFRAHLRDKIEAQLNSVRRPIRIPTYVQRNLFPEGQGSCVLHLLNT